MISPSDSLTVPARCSAFDEGGSRSRISVGLLVGLGRPFGRLKSGFVGLCRAKSGYGLGGRGSLGPWVPGPFPAIFTFYFLIFN